MLNIDYFLNTQYTTIEYFITLHYYLIIFIVQKNESSVCVRWVRGKGEKVS